MKRGSRQTRSDKGHFVLSPTIQSDETNPKAPYKLAPGAGAVFITDETPDSEHHLYTAIRMIERGVHPIRGKNVELTKYLNAVKRGITRPQIRPIEAIEMTEEVMNDQAFWPWWLKLSEPGVRTPGTVGWEKTDETVCVSANVRQVVSPEQNYLCFYTAKMLRIVTPGNWFVKYMDGDLELVLVQSRVEFMKLFQMFRSFDAKSVLRTEINDL